MPPVKKAFFKKSFHFYWCVEMCNSVLRKFISLKKKEYKEIKVYSFKRLSNALSEGNVCCGLRPLICDL